MHAPTDAVSGEKVKLRFVALWSVPLIVLFVAWLWSAFWRGGSDPIDWLPGALLVGATGLLVAALVAYPRRPRQLSMVVLTLLGIYTVWVAASALWADSAGRVWLEAERTSLLFLLFALALVYLTDAGARVLFRYLLMAAALVLVAGCAWRLWTVGQVGLLFQDGRLTFPTGYPNGSAALFLIAFWPLMWLAAGPSERAPVRGVALGLATGLLALAVMTQSRGALYSLAVTLVIVFIICPIRLRTLLYLIVPGMLMVYAFPELNRYWLEGPEAVGGTAGARTLLIATVAAAFMGMIVALLERWIPASRRMKAIFGTVVVVGVLAAIVYGAIVLTEDDGGPWGWVSRSWHQFTAETESPELPPRTATDPRFAVVGSSETPAIWKASWQVFQSERVFGVGADNFSFAYDLLRDDGASDPVPAHSLPLQVLAETGVVGAGLMGLGILLALGGLLWGRSTAGWRRARRLWLRFPGRAPLSGDGSRFCNARWGEDPATYGWEMALLAALAYWLIHAGFDRLWQITAVAIPALLLLAAGLSAVDARAGTMWPRWERWLRIASPDSEEDDGPDHDGDDALETGAAPQPELEPEPQLELEPELEPEPWTTPEAAAARRRPDLQPEEGSFFVLRRSDQYDAKWKRRRRRAARRRRSAERLQPAGPLSMGFRVVLLAVSVLVIAGATPPYLSLQLQRSAVALAETDGMRAARRAGTAGWVWPGDPGPLATKGAIYAAAAGSHPEAGAPAVLDDLALALTYYEQAAGREPNSWWLRYQAGVAALNMMIVSTDPSGTTDPLSAAEYTAAIPLVPGLGDWTWLAQQGAGQDASKNTGGSLWPSYGVPDIAHLYRSLTPAQLRDVSLAFLTEARELSPQAPEVAQAIALVLRLSH